MKRLSCFTGLIAVVIIFYSCSDKKDLIGKWDDNIKLSDKSIEFEAYADSVTITTEGDHWWLTAVTVNGESYPLPEGIDAASDHYTFKQDCFVVERRDKNTLFVKAEENQLNIQRVITIGFQAGDYFDWVTITQAAK